MEFEIYFEDLKQEKQKEIAEALKTTPQELIKEENLDVVTLAYIFLGEGD